MYPQDIYRDCPTMLPPDVRIVAHKANLLLLEIAELLREQNKLLATLAREVQQ